MLLVFDSNEYLFGFGLVRKVHSERLIDLLISRQHPHQIRIPRLVQEEVRRNLPPQTFARFIRIIRPLTSIDEDLVVPFELGVQYEARGLKQADAFIAAYTEWVGADALVSKNRHFLTLRRDLPFRVLTAEQCLKLF